MSHPISEEGGDAGIAVGKDVIGYWVGPDPGSIRLTAYQWKAGIAAWLGWMFDGLDMHLYTLVAAPFVAQLLRIHDTADPQVKQKSAFIQAAFLVGWALGGSVFGRLGDRLGRSRALGMTILTYAVFTGLSFIAQTWWQLLIFRFLSALGIGGEWAVGSSLLSETWPPRWRAWVAAVLQSGVNIGVLLACGVVYVLAAEPRYVFLVGVLPAFLVFWIRRAVPEPEPWLQAKAAAAEKSGSGEAGERTAAGGLQNRKRPSAVLSGSGDYPSDGADVEPGMGDLFRGSVRRITLLSIGVCACSLTAWWGFLFWYPQQLRNLPGLQSWDAASRDRLVSISFFASIGTSIVGNFFAAWLARLIGYRRAIAVLCLAFFCMLFATYRVERGYVALLWLTPGVGFCSGVFGLFTMYLPPLFPTLLRSTGAGFSYNIGRLAAAAGTVFFGLYAAHFSQTDSLRQILKYDSLLFVPAMLLALQLPDLKDGDPDPSGVPLIPAVAPLAD